MSATILVVYDTNGGNTEKMAQCVARGINKVNGCEAKVRRTAKVSTTTESTEPAVPESGAVYVSTQDLHDIDGLIIGSPTHYGNMSASLKYFIDQTTTQWLNGTLEAKPGAAFTSTGSMHGGQEFTLQSMLIPLMHHGMLIVGLPYSHPGLMQTSRGGTPYGASHVSGEKGDHELDETEASLCKLLGQRVAQMALRLKSD